MTKTECHRTALACMAGGIHAGGFFHWTCFPRVPAIADCIGHGSSTCHLVIGHMAISGSCTFQVLNGPCVEPLLFHMSIFYWHTCRVVVGPCVISSLDHVSYFFGPRGYFVFDHMSRCYPSMFRFFDSATWLDGFLSRVRFLLAHVSCQGYFTCHALVHPRVIFLFDHVACPVSPRAKQSIYHKSNSRSSLLHRLTT
jgi:hypothetical protein